MRLGVFKISDHDFLRNYEPEYIDNLDPARTYACDVLLWNNNHAFSPDTLDFFPDLKLLINWGIEDANLHSEETLRSKVQIKKVESYAHQAMAEFALMLLLEFERSQGGEARNLYGKKVGIIGLGKIGFAIAEILHSSFHCEISYNTRNDYRLRDFSYKTPADIFRTCDTVILTPRAKTCSLGRDVLKSAHPGTVIVNIARDSVLPFRGIEPYLKKKKIRGFVGDVLDADNNLQTDRNVLIAPKIGYKTLETIALKRHIALHYLKQFISREGNRRLSVFVARHGQSESNVNGVYDGTRNSPLTDEGREQVRKASLFFLKKKIGGIFSSPLGRARESAEIISETIGMPVTIIPAFREMDFGIFQGQSRKSMEELFPDFFLQRSKSPHCKLYTPYPSGESYFNVYTRAVSAFAELLATRENFVIVGHESVNRIIRGFALNKPLTTMIKDRQKNTDIVEIDLLEDSEKIHLI